MQYRECITPKGTRTMLIKSPGSTAATIQIWFKAGSSLETANNQGIAHFLEHMFFKGTKKRPGSKIAHDVESFGGEINAFTSFDYTCYYINCPKSKIIKSTEILLDMVSSPLFAEKDIIPEREVVLEELKRSIDNPSQYSFSKVQQEAFSGAYERAILGETSTIKKFDQKMLIDFKNKFYNASNMLIVVAGDFDEAKIIKTIDSFKLPLGKESKRPAFKMKTVGKVHVHQKETNMCQLSITCQGHNYLSPSAPAEDLAINCLGHGETSPLYQKLVTDTTLANYASATTMYMTSGSAHILRLNFPMESITKVYEQLLQILKESLKDGFKAKEISKIQNQYVASKIYEKESLESFAFTLGNSYVQTDDYLCEQKFIEQLNATKPNAVNNSLRDIFTRELHFSVQIPLSENKTTALKHTKQLASSLKKLKANCETNEKLLGITSNYDPQVRQIQLKNGISLIYRYNNITPTFAMHIYTKGGITEETKENNGIYGLISSLLTRGYKGCSNDSLKHFLEDNSASLHGFSGKNAYGMTMHGMTRNAHELFSHFFNSFFNPEFPAYFLKHEKELAIRSLKMQEEDPVKHCFEAFNNLVFNNHPYAMNILGSKQSLKRINRKMILEMHEKNIKNKNIQITYCGDMSLREILKLISPYIEKLPARKTSKLIRKKYSPIYDSNKFIKFDREQAHIIIGTPTSHLGHKDNIYLKMITAHLLGQSSELFIEVRDRQGLCYSAQPINFMALEGGYWAIYIATSNDKIDRVKIAIKNLITRIAEKGIKKNEFNKIKTMLKGQEEINIQTNDDYANVYSVPALQGLGLDYFHKNAEAIEAVDYDDFQTNIKRILSKSFNTVIIGNQSS